ncbi:hypothetical protein V5J36_003579 [Endozoicomonas sp. NE41]
MTAGKVDSGRLYSGNQVFNPNAQFLHPGKVCLNLQLLFGISFCCRFFDTGNPFNALFQFFSQQSQCVIAPGFRHQGNLDNADINRRDTVNGQHRNIFRQLVAYFGNFGYHIVILFLRVSAVEELDLNHRQTIFDITL